MLVAIRFACKYTDYFHTNILLKKKTQFSMLKFSYYIVPDSLYNARREFPILHTPARTLVFPLSIPVHRVPLPLYIIYFFLTLTYDVFLIEKQESKIDKSVGFSLCFEVISDRNDIFRKTKSSFMDKKCRFFGRKRSLLTRKTKF